MLYLSCEKYEINKKEKKTYLTVANGCVYKLGKLVLGGDSFPGYCGFESQHRILDGHFDVNLVMLN